MDVLTTLNASNFYMPNRKDPYCQLIWKFTLQFLASDSQLCCHSIIQKQPWYSEAGAKCDKVKKFLLTGHTVKCMSSRLGVQSHAVLSWLKNSLIWHSWRQIFLVFLFLLPCPYSNFWTQLILRLRELKHTHLSWFYKLADPSPI